MSALSGLHQVRRHPDQFGGAGDGCCPDFRGIIRVPEAGRSARSDADQVMNASPLKLIAPTVKLGERVRIFDFTNLYGCSIGDDSKIGTFVEVQKGVVIGKRCKISSHTFICEGVTIEDDVFVGHNVTFINDRFPRATNEGGNLQTEEDWKCEPTMVRKGASIGSSVTVLCGVTVGERAIIGAGSVVTKNVPPDTIVAGNPARVVRKIIKENVE